MNEPVHDELAELVALLRSATPPADTLEQVRTSVLAQSARGATASAIIVRIGLAMGAIVVVGGPPDASTAPLSPAPRSASEIEAPAAPIEAVEEERAAPRMEVSVVLPSEKRSQGATREQANRPSPPERPPVIHPAAPIAAAPVVAQAVPSPAAIAPSAVLGEARRDYAARRYGKAAVGFARVVDGTTDDAPEHVATAEFFLAKCLYQLELYHAAAAAFDEVTLRGEEHPYFVESLPWLAMLAERLPEPSGVIESVGRYRAEGLDSLDVPHTRDHYHHVLYLLGRARYEEGRFSDAVRILSRVPDNTRWALEARFFEGVSHVRMHRSRPAHAAFRRVIDSFQANRTGGHPDANRLHELAWMSVARLYYSQAMQQPNANDAHASELLTLAIAAWRRIPESSDYYLESFSEETWGLYIAREYARALGHVHALDSPLLRDRGNPEAQVVRAMIFAEHCQWNAADSALSRFHRRYDPVLVDAQVAARMASSNENAYRMLVAVRAERSRVPPRVLPALRKAFEDRELMRHLEQVRSIAREERRLSNLGAPLLDSALRPRVAGDLAALRALAVDRTGRLARARVHRVATELEERMTQMDTIELEVATARREELTHPNRRPMGPANGGPIWAVQGDQIWPFNGEWWPDELPFFVQEVQNRCSR